MAAKKGKNNAKTAAQQAERRASADQPLKRARTCCQCGGAITTLGQLEPVKVVCGKARMKARCKGGCKRAA